MAYPPSDRHETAGHVQSAVRYSVEDIEAIATELKHTDNPTWSKYPRLYLILRGVNKLELLDELIRNEVSDLWIPLSRSFIDSYPSLAATDILSSQAVVLTNNLALDGGKQHRHLHWDTVIPFEEQARLGKGGIQFGVVEAVSCFGRKFVRKTYWRRELTSSDQRYNMSTFKKEIEVF